MFVCVCVGGVYMSTLFLFLNNNRKSIRNMLFSDIFEDMGISNFNLVLMRGGGYNVPITDILISNSRAGD